MLSKAASSTIFWVFGMTRRETKLRSTDPLASTLLIRLKKQDKNAYKITFYFIFTDFCIKLYSELFFNTFENKGII